MELQLISRVQRWTLWHHIPDEFPSLPMLYPPQALALNLQEFSSQGRQPLLERDGKGIEKAKINKNQRAKESGKREQKKDQNGQPDS